MPATSHRCCPGVDADAAHIVRCVATLFSYRTSALKGAPDWPCLRAILFLTNPGRRCQRASWKKVSLLAPLKHLKRDREHYSCFVNHMVGGLDGNPDRPAPTHAQHIACRAKLAGAIRVQYDRVGPHKHILHGRI